LAIASALLLLTQSGLTLLGLFFLKRTLDALTTALANPAPTEAFGYAAVFIGASAAVAIIGVLCRSVLAAVTEVQRGVVSDHTLDVLHAKAVEVDLEYYETSRYFDTLHRAQVEAPTRAPAVLTTMLLLASSSVSLAAVSGLLLAFHWWVGLVLVAGAIPGALVRVRLASERYRWDVRSTATARRADYFSALLTTASYAPEIRLLDLGGLFRERFGLLRRQLRRERQQIIVRRVGGEVVTQVGAVATIYGVYAFVAYQVLAGALTLGDLVMYFAAFQRVQSDLQELFGGLARLYEDHLFLSTTSEFLAIPRKVADPPHPRPVPRPLCEGISFEHVDFRYPGSSSLALHNICLTIRPGERIALVGRNGSGKSTLIKLLCRLYDPCAGRITVDGIPLTWLSQVEWRREIGVMLQDSCEYHATARDNIWFGNLAPLVDDQPIISAAQRTGAHDVIASLSHGYDTQLGKWLGDGAELSVGEWQKIALARTYVRDAQLMVLDEPTSAMDALAEQALLESVWTVSERRTTLLITHRLAMARLADRILVLEGGRLVQCGNHAELMRCGGPYAELFAAQAEHYRS
jgi:ATP-binding cassette subfamily B protein